MAITDPQAVRFCNEVIRPLADVATQYYYKALSALNEWTANDMGTLIPNTSDIVDDGADVDGRAQITGAMVNGLKTNVAAFVADMQANSNLKLNVLLQIEVNGSP